MAVSGINWAGNFHMEQQQGVTHYSSGTAQKAAQSAQFKRWRHNRHIQEALRMKLLRRAADLIGHEPIEGEFVRLTLLDDAAFQAARARLLARRPMPARTDNAGVTFLISLIGAPTCLLLGIIKDDSVFLASAIFWLIVGLVLFFYLVLSARYWREHRAIISEELRRYGHTSFG